MDENSKTEDNPGKTDQKTNSEDRPKRGLEDWEMLQTREEPPLKVPYWLIMLIVGLLIGSILLTFPLMGVREGYERPWLDWGLLVGVGYGVVALLMIYLFMRGRKKSANESKSRTDDLNE